MQHMAFGTIEQALEDLRAGKFLVVADDEDRENEGDLIGAAEFITADRVNFMISGPVMIQALQGEGAILKNRDLMGATDPKKAAPGTIRADFAESIDANAVHGSDAPETAVVEIAYFFPASEIHSR